MTTTVICGYSLSGGYGPIPRFLYYILLIVSIIFHKTEWLVGSTLGASMIFGSIAAVHAVALASARGRGTVDLDIIPVFSITGVGMVISVPLLMWSKALREAKRSIRIITFLWIMIMSIGVISSLASLAKLPTPLVCRDQSMAGCPLICETPLPMRDGQPILVVPFVASDLYVYWWTVVYPGLGFPLTISGLMMAQRRKHPVQQTRDAFKANYGLTRRMRRKYSNNTMFCAVCAPPLSVGLGVAHVVLMELILNRPWSIPLGENMTAIGQWGSLVGAALALIASIIEWRLSEADRGVMRRDQQHRDIKLNNLRAFQWLRIFESSSQWRNQPFRSSEGGVGSLGASVDRWNQASRLGVSDSSLSFDKKTGRETFWALPVSNRRHKTTNGFTWLPLSTPLRRHRRTTEFEWIYM